MPRPPPADADLRDPLPSLARGSAVLATAAALVIAALVLLQSDSAQPGVALPWLLAVGIACTAAAVVWALWRQREIGRAHV